MLLVYSKIWLSGRLIDTDVAEDPYLGAELTRYFPKPVQRRFPREIQKHQLRREIIVTATTNSLVNRMGPGFAIRTQEDTGADVGSIARAYSIAREITDMRDLWADIEALDDKVAGRAAVRRCVRDHAPAAPPDLLGAAQPRHQPRHRATRVSRLRPGIRELMAGLPDLLDGIEVDALREARSSAFSRCRRAAQASRAASRAWARSTPSVDIVEVALARRAPVAQAARVYFGLGAAIGLDWIRGEIERLPVEGHWQALARGTLREEAVPAAAPPRPTRCSARRTRRRARAHRRLAQDRRRRPRQRDAARCARCARSGSADFPTLSVALQAVRQLAEG